MMSNSDSVDRKSPAGASGSSAEGASRTKSPAGAAGASGAAGSSAGGAPRDKKTPWFFNFEGPGAGAGVLPSQVKFFPARTGSKKPSHDSWEARNPRNKEGPARGFATKEEAYGYAGARMVPCPLDGRMVPEGDTGALCRYLASMHPGEWMRLKRESGGKVWRLFVYRDCYSIDRRYKHDSVPGHSFATIDDMNWALRESGKSNPAFRNPHFRERKGGTTFFKGKDDSPKASRPSTPPKAKVRSKPPDAPLKKSSNRYDVLGDAGVKKLDPVLEVVDETRHEDKQADASQPLPKKVRKSKPAEKLPAEKAPDKEEPVVELPAEKAPDKEEPVVELPTEKAPVAELPAEKAPVKEEPAKEDPAKKKPTKEEPAKKKPTKKEPVQVPSWKAKCLAEKTKRDAMVKQLEDDRIKAEAEVQRLKEETEAEVQRLKEETEAEEERSKVEAEDARKQTLFGQFKGMVMLPSKTADEPKKGSAKRSKGHR
jgi:hypothetical protein